MLFRKSTIVLLAAIALCASSCTTSRKATSSERLQVTAYRLQDTVREQVTVVVMDTVREITTVTVRENEVGDTLRVTTVTDRTRASSRDRYHDVQEKVLVRTDTVYIERTADTTALIAGPTRDPNKDSPGRNIRRSLMWIFFILSAIIILIIIIKIFR